MPPAPAASPEQLLQAKFPAKHVKAAVLHFQAMTLEFQQSDWEQAIGKGGKFVEAALKALQLHTGGTVPPARQFKAGDIITRLENLPRAAHDDTIRITIPRACRFAYDVASNRGARHDPEEIDPNEMDARVMVATASWILAETLRYSQKGAIDQDAVRELVDRITQRKYPIVEEVDGRVYFHVPGASARDVALLSLWHRHPGRISREDLKASLVRHRFSANNAALAITRIGRLVDDDGQDRLRLLQPGLLEAEALISSARANDRR